VLYNNRASGNGDRKQKPLYLCSPFVDAALVKGNFKTIVVLPKYVDIMEWVAVNSAYHSCQSTTVTANEATPAVVHDFFTNLNEFYGVIATEACTAQSCPTMSAGPSYVPDLASCRDRFSNVLLYRLNYLWTNRDGKQVSLPAPTYIDYVVTSIQQLIDDENVFPHNASMSLSSPCASRPLSVPAP